MALLVLGDLSLSIVVLQADDDVHESAFAGSRSHPISWPPFIKTHSILAGAL